MQTFVLSVCQINNGETYLLASVNNSGNDSGDRLFVLVENTDNVTEKQEVWCQTFLPCQQDKSFGVFSH